MCHYNITYCESCKAISYSLPFFCEKIKSGIICTNYGSRDRELSGVITICMMAAFEKAYDEFHKELRLYDILDAKEIWINHTTCSCGLINIYPINECSNMNSMINDVDDKYTTDDSETDIDYWCNMGEGEWDSNGGSPQWVPRT